MTGPWHVINNAEMRADLMEAFAHHILWEIEKVKVSGLQGALLDYWVARANGWTRSADVWVDDQGIEQFHPAVCYDPSHDWALGGPIIERERGAINPEWQGQGEPVVYWARMGDGVHRYQASGPTHLVAAMRAYVSSKFGEEVAEE